MKHVLIPLLTMPMLFSIAHAELTRQAEHNGLLVSVSVQDKLFTGTESAVKITLQNKSGKSLLLPILPWNPSYTLDFSADQKGGLYYDRRLLMRDLVHLDPEETKEFIFILRPRISSPCRLRVEFYNDRSTVSIMEDVSMKAREGVNVARPVEKDVEEPDLWRGHVIIEIPMTVAKRAARGRYSVEAFPRLGVLQQHEFLETLHPTQNEGDCEVIAEAIRMLPRENPLRFRCWSSLAPALAKGVGAALVPFAVDELENKENTQPLRILLVQLVAELRSKPALECDEDHNLICIKLTEEVRARIDRVLEVVSADPVLAEAAKVDPPEDDR